MVLWCQRNCDIVEADDLLPSDNWILVLLLSLVRVVSPAVDAVELSVIVFLGEDSVAPVDNYHLPPISLYRLISQGLRVVRLEDTNFDIDPVFFSLIIISLPDLQSQADIIELGRPQALEVHLLQVDESGDDFTLGAVDLSLVQALHHGLPHGVAGAGGDGALVGGGRCGPRGSGGDLLWK